MSDTSPPPAIRASDAERQRTVLVLRDAVVEGRLTLEEYSERVGLAIAAKTDRDLNELTRDLPTGQSRALASGGPLTHHRALFSHLIRRGPLRLAREASYLSLFGTIDLDLREARLPGPEVDLTVRNIFGTVTVVVPDGVEVQIDGGGLFASEKIEVSATRPIDGAPVIRIHSSGPGGTIYVRSAA
jgi:uncharacterized protein DUF1707/cell wall-active antibiotic response 4TMS protein YvqF